MKLVSYVPADALPGATPRPGVLVDEGRAVVGLEHLGAPTMQALLLRWDALLPEVRELAEQRRAVPVALPLDRVRLTAPVPAPTSLTAVGLNYRDHAEETGSTLPQEPMFFLLHPSSVTGPDAPVVLPAESARVDYEAELAVVIGRAGYRVTVEEALGHVAGYMAFNDVSARDVQRRMGQWSAAKSYPTFSPCGPWLVTPDEVGDPQTLSVTTVVNGRTLQSSSTTEMVFGVAELVSRVSRTWPLRPGDVIATGTPAGVGVARTPPVLLADGDVVEVAITGLGTLRNRVVREAVS